MELTPLIDVVLLLLIFFMVSASFIRETRLDIELPAASGQPRAMDAAVVEVVVHRDGSYRVNDKPVDRGSPYGLRAALVEAADRLAPRDVRLIIAADASSTHQAVVMALEAAGQAGLQRVGIVTQHRQETASPAAGASDSGGSPAIDPGQPHGG